MYTELLYSVAMARGRHRRYTLPNLRLLLRFIIIFKSNHIESVCGFFRLPILRVCVHDGPVSFIYPHINKVFNIYLSENKAQSCSNICMQASQVY